MPPSGGELVGGLAGKTRRFAALNDFPSSYQVTAMRIYSEDDYALASPVFSRDANAQTSIDDEGGEKQEPFTLPPVALGTVATVHTAERPKPRLEVVVVFTDAAGTLAALKNAEGLAQRLDAHLRLLVPYEVPYVLPLAKPPVPVEFLEGQIRELAAKINLDVAAQVYLCRDKKRALDILMKPHSLVVVGGKKRWWPTAAQSLAQSLEARGHQVIFTDLR
jgi:hypothetical protein